MKRIILSLSIVLMLTSNSFSQEINPSGFLLELLFPEVADYMERMETKINDMEARLSAIQNNTYLAGEWRDNYIMYQHWMGITNYNMAYASVDFTVANTYYIAGNYSDYLKWWGYGNDRLHTAWDTLDYALDCQESIMVNPEDITCGGSPFELHLIQPMIKAKTVPEKD